MQNADTGSKTSMSTSVINCCSLLQPAKFGELHSQSRYFDSELRLNLDLRDSVNVLEATNQTQVTLTNALTTETHFHVMLVGLSVREAHDNSDLLVIFIAPKDPAMELARPSVWSYVWGSSLIQVQPTKVSRLDRGRMVVDQSNSQPGTLVLRTSSKEEGVETSVMLDLEKRQLRTAGPSLGGQERTWVRMQCWRMPGTACRVTRGPEC
jgi:hypothetical protein